MLSREDRIIAPKVPLDLDVSGNLRRHLPFLDLLITHVNSLCKLSITEARRGYLQKPKLLYFQQNFAFGATEEYITDLALHLGDRGFEVHVAYPDITVMERFQTLIGNKAIHHPIPATHYITSAAQSLPYWVSWFRSLKPTIVHFNDPVLVCGIAAWLTRVPIRIVTHHTPELVRHYNRAGQILARIAFNSYTRYIFTSEYSLETGLTRDQLKRNKSTVIPYGLRSPWFESVNQEERIFVRSELGLSNEDVMILNPARLSMQKRHDVLLSAARSVVDQVPNAHFVLAGDGELLDQIKTQVERSGIASNVHIVGFRKDILKLVSAADIVVMSSDFEGLCYAVIEAGARCVPTVATDVGGMRYSVEDGVTGLLVPPRNPNELALAILELIHDPEKRRKLGRAGRGRAEKLFTVERMVAHTAKIYEALLDEHSK